MTNNQIKKIAIIGAGKIGQAIANGMTKSGQYLPSQITMTRKDSSMLTHLQNAGYGVTIDNSKAIKSAQLIVVSVGPQDAKNLLNVIKTDLDPKMHILVSTVAGVTIEFIENIIGTGFPIVRIMPNTAISICESMTCLAAKDEHSESMESVKRIFDQLGLTLVVKEELIGPATALCGSGLAFFLRAVQTARGAASLTLESKMHPESEIDKVTTPKGITISGLNEMEHQGFSSAMIRAIVRSAEKLGSIF
jgi:pyrroline-5-carboxylate reductase